MDRVREVMCCEGVHVPVCMCMGDLVVAQPYLQSCQELRVKYNQEMKPLLHVLQGVQWDLAELGCKSRVKFLLRFHRLQHAQKRQAHTVQSNPLHCAV